MYVAWAKLSTVLVSPKVFTQQSVTPASLITDLAVSAATIPSPRGPGKIWILTFPQWPAEITLTEWLSVHPHSQLPQPRLTGNKVNRDLFRAFSIALCTCGALFVPIPIQPSLFPTITVALNRDFSPASVCFWTNFTSITSYSKLGIRCLVISGSFNTKFCVITYFQERK